MASSAVTTPTKRRRFADTTDMTVRRKADSIGNVDLSKQGFVNFFRARVVHNSFGGLTRTLKRMRHLTIQDGTGSLKIAMMENYVDLGREL